MYADIQRPWSERDDAAQIEVCEYPTLARAGSGWLSLADPRCAADKDNEGVFAEHRTFELDDAADVPWRLVAGTPSWV